MRSKGSRGFSLIEMLIALVIAGVGLSSLLVINTTLLKANKNVEVLSGFSDFINTLRFGLKNPVSCALNLNTTHFSSIEINNDSTQLSKLVIEVNKLSTLGQAQPIATLNSEVPGILGTKINSMKIQNFRELTPKVSYVADLAFRLNKSESTIGSREIGKSIPIYFGATNNGATSTLTSCSVSDLNLSQDDLADIKRQVCLSMNGTFNMTTRTCTLPTQIVLKMGDMGDAKIVLPSNIQMSEMTIIQGDMGDVIFNVPQLQIGTLNVAPKSSLKGLKNAN